MNEGKLCVDRVKYEHYLCYALYDASHVKTETAKKMVREKVKDEEREEEKKEKKEKEEGKAEGKQ